MLHCDRFVAKVCQDCGESLEVRHDGNVGAFPRRIRLNRCDACHVDWLNGLDRRRWDDADALRYRQESEA